MMYGESELTFTNTSYTCSFHFFTLVCKASAFTIWEGERRDKIVIGKLHLPFFGAPQSLTLVFILPSELCMYKIWTYNNI